MLQINGVAIIGSTVNGTASTSSDLDINVTAYLDCGEIVGFLQELNSFLSERHSECIQELRFIENARVPILRFKMKSVDVDLCINNGAAEWNTKFIEIVSDVDERIRPLLFMVKNFVKNVGLYGAMYVEENVAIVGNVKYFGLIIQKYFPETFLRAACCQVMVGH